MALGVNPLCSEAIYGKGLALKEMGKSYGFHQSVLSQIDNDIII